MIRIIGWVASVLIWSIIFVISFISKQKINKKIYLITVSVIIFHAVIELAEAIIIFE